VPHGWKEMGYLNRLRPRLLGDVKLLGVVGTTMFMSSQSCGMVVIHLLDYFKRFNSLNMCDFV